MKNAQAMAPSSVKKRRENPQSVSLFAENEIENFELSDNLQRKFVD
jgi:hypothetical protein